MTIASAAFISAAVLLFNIGCYLAGRRAGVRSVPKGAELVELRARLLLVETENKAILTPEGRDAVICQRERERLADILQASAKASSGFPAQVMRHNASWLRQGGPDYRPEKGKKP